MAFDRPIIRMTATRDEFKRQPNVRSPPGRERPRQAVLTFRIDQDRPMNASPRRLGAVLVFLAMSLDKPGQADEPPQSAVRAKTVRLLTIGNSFSNNATAYLGQLAAAAGHTLIHRPMAVSGASLEVHWNRLVAHDADPHDPAGLYGVRNLRAELRADRWDFITLQQASIVSHDPASYRPFAGRLLEVIRQEARTSTVLMHQTWAYRVDDQRFRDETPGVGQPRSRDEMHARLTEAYDGVAQEFGLDVIPVGDAFHLADSDLRWGYEPDGRFDFATARRPMLPDQTHSLHAGWFWGPEHLQLDGRHASQAGKYLAAAVWLEVLFGTNPVGNAFIPPGLDPAHARFLQDVAHQAVMRRTARRRAAGSPASLTTSGP
jgi:hypothetical protein